MVFLSDLANTNPKSDLSTDYSLECEECSHQHRHHQQQPLDNSARINSTTNRENTARKLSPSAAAEGVDDNVILSSICQKTESQQRPFEFDLSVSRDDAEDGEEEEEDL